jgi:WD40 repeat protein
VSWNKTGKQLATGADDNTVRIWDTDSGMMIRELRGHIRYVLSVSWDSVGKRLATSSYDATVRIWDIENSICLATLQLDSPIYAVTWSPTSGYL